MSLLIAAVLFTLIHYIIHTVNMQGIQYDIIMSLLITAVLFTLFHYIIYTVDSSCSIHTCSLHNLYSQYVSFTVLYDHVSVIAAVIFTLVHYIIYTVNMLGIQEYG